jgi:hypothetical protein
LLHRQGDDKAAAGVRTAHRGNLAVVPVYNFAANSQPDPTSSNWSRREALEGLKIRSRSSRQTNPVVLHTITAWQSLDVLLVVALLR